MSITCNCKGCDKRTKDCHISCEDYKAYKEKMNERSRTIFFASLADNTIRRCNVKDKYKSLKRWIKT